jgi:DNA-binding response OmpR family regulator
MKMKQILIIEDDINIRETLSDILELKGYDVIAAEDGQSGILKAARYKPDLIICDIMMPKQNGYQVLETIRNNRWLMLKPFIFLSAKSSKEEVFEGLHKGANQYITKPFTNSELFTAIDTLSSQYQTASI